MDSKQIKEMVSKNDSVIGIQATGEFFTVELLSGQEITSLNLKEVHDILRHTGGEYTHLLWWAMSPW